MKKRADLRSNLGTKFDTIASIGHLNEEDQAQMSHEEFVSLRLNGLDFEKLRLVEEALNRLASGEYGICLECEEQIAPKRLCAVPWALYCVECQERLAASVDGSDREQAGMPQPVYY